VKLPVVNIDLKRLAAWVYGPNRDKTRTRRELRRKQRNRNKARIQAESRRRNRPRGKRVRRTL